MTARRTGWIKQAIFNYLENWRTTRRCLRLPALLSGAANESDDASEPTEEPYQPFLEFAEQILPQSVSRAAITAAWRRPETDAVPMLLEQARLPQPLGEQAPSWRISWRKNCATRKPPAAAPAWCRACCRSSPSLHRKGWR
ncbi:transcriptional regulator [Klebsiella pneumoniae subsp. pneumoniae]|nr:transcriptional regulator [Klebsiella pneumoniae subsp. pneumoniae]